MSNAKTFSDLGLEVRQGQPKVNETVPMYGMITNILAETENSLVVELNHNIELTINNTTKENIQIVKERIFEPGIFIATITNINLSENKTHHYEATSKTVIFGRKQEMNS
jgi:hypothetical protein